MHSKHRLLCRDHAVFGVVLRGNAVYRFAGTNSGIIIGVTVLQATVVYALQFTQLVPGKRTVVVDKLQQTLQLQSTGRGEAYLAPYYCYVSLKYYIIFVTLVTSLSG